MEVKKGKQSLKERNLRNKLYVRTKDGKIDKLINSNFYMSIYVECEKGLYLIENIVKHSKQLIDLIENKDILKVRIDKTIMFFGIDESTSDTKYKEIIKSIENGECELLEILTHQQFEANCYKVGGE
jgi:hypothetical protein|nr:MAG TPA: hypothetical protein [Bacteriophage sp.]